jgi:hypothetical protein
MRQIILIISVFLTTNLISQDKLPDISNDFKSDILYGIEKNKKLSEYEFILIKYVDNYWHSNINYRLIAYRSNTVDLYQVIKKKKNNHIRIKTTTSGNPDDFLNLIDSLNNIGFFNLTCNDFNSEIVNSDGSTTRQEISVGTSQMFAIYVKGKTWGLEVYEPKSQFDFSKNKNFNIVLKAINLVDEFFYKN